MAESRVVGITVLPEYIQSEGVDRLLDNLVMKCKANAVATSPYLMEPADEKTGQREPPADAGAGAVRLLDRPLWGKRELFVRTSPSFAPEKKLYNGLKYLPSAPDDLTRREGHILHDLIKAAQARHIKVYFQVQAAIPPGYRVQFGGPDETDRPRLPDGSLPPKRLAKNGSLASENVLKYQHALIRDLCQQYPDLDGLRFDWPEYPPYFLDDIFLDFSPAAQQAAKRLGFDFERMQREAGRLYRKLHGGLTDADLIAWTEPDGNRHGLLRWLVDHPGIADWLRFKAQLVEQLIQGFRRTMNEFGGQRMELLSNAFPPPWSLASGMDFAKVGRHSSGICMKHYTMHWPMMLRFYADQLLQANPKLSDALLGRTLATLLDLSDDDGLPKATDYHYPGPDEPHPVGSQSLSRKVLQAQREAGPTPVYPLAHGYGPLADFRRRLEAAHHAGPHGFWVNRYGYLSDEKLSLIGQVASQQTPERR